MRKVNLILVTVIAFVFYGQTAKADVLATFNLNSYVGWTYTNPGYTLTTSNIDGKHITFFTGGDGTKYSLTSPQIDFSRYPSIVVSFPWVRALSSFPSDITLCDPIIEILDASSNMVQSSEYTLVGTDKTHSVDMNITLPQHFTNGRIRLSAPKVPSSNNAMYIQSMSITGDIPTGLIGITEYLPRIWAENKDIRVDNASGQIIEVYDMQGVCRYRAASLDGINTIEVSLPGLYIVKVGKKVCKVQIR